MTLNVINVGRCEQANAVYNLCVHNVMYIYVQMYISISITAHRHPIEYIAIVIPFVLIGAAFTHEQTSLRPRELCWSTKFTPQRHLVNGVCLEAGVKKLCDHINFIRLAPLSDLSDMSSRNSVTFLEINRAD